MMFRKSLSFSLLIVSILLLSVFSFTHPPKMYQVVYNPPMDAGNVKFDGFLPGQIVFLVFNYLLIFFFGYVLIFPLLKSMKESVALKYLSSFFPGYLGCVALARINSLIFPMNQFYVPTFIMIILIMGYLMMQYRWIKSVSQQNWLKNTGIVLFFILALVFVLILQMRQNIGNFLWVGHGPDQYAYLHDRWQLEQLKYFPMIKQHYDELLFHEWLFNPLLRQFDPIIIWWITLGLMKVSIVFLAFLFFCRMKMNQVVALACSLYFAIGTLSLNFTKYYMLFDSSNLLWMIAHSGRIVEVGIIILFIWSAVIKQESVNRLPIISWFLIGLGLTGTSFTNSLLFLLLYSFIICLGFIEKRSVEKSSIDMDYALCLFVVAVCLSFYALPMIEPFFKLRLLLLGLVLSFYIFRMIYMYVGTSQCLVSNLLNRDWIVLCSATILGFALLGNIFSDNLFTHQLMKVIHPDQKSFEIIQLPPFKGHQVYPQNPTFKIGDFREVGEWNQYCHGLVPFISCYGGMLTMVLLIGFGWRRWLSDENRSDIGEKFYELFLLSAVLLPCFLFFMDFFDLGIRAWIKSRFLEFPIYMILLMFFYFLSKFKSRQILIITVLIAYSFLPFLASGRPFQIQENWRILIDLVRR